MLVALLWSLLLVITAFLVLIVVLRLAVASRTIFLGRRTLSRFLSFALAPALLLLNSDSSAIDHQFYLNRSKSQPLLQLTIAFVPHHAI